MTRRELDDRIGWHKELEVQGRWKSEARENGRVSEPYQPWWLPGDLRLTHRGQAALIMAQVFLALLTLLLGLAFVGGMEQGSL